MGRVQGMERVEDDEEGTDSSSFAFLASGAEESESLSSAVSVGFSGSVLDSSRAEDSFASSVDVTFRTSLDSSPRMEELATAVTQSPT